MSGQLRFELTDGLLEEMLVERAGFRAPADLVDTIVAAAEATPQRRPSILPALPGSTWSHASWPVLPRTTAILWIAALVLALVAALVLAGSQPPLPKPFGLARPGLVASSDGTSITIAQVDGQGARSISSAGRIETSPAWSRDGTELAFWSQPATTGPASLVIARPDGSQRRVLFDGIRPASDVFVAYGPLWSPDGTRLLYAVIDPSTTVFEIDVIAIAGGKPVTLVRYAPPGANPAWSPDGRSIAFGGGTSGFPDRGVWIVPADGGTVARRLSTVAGGDGAFSDIAWSPDGSRLAYRAGSAGAWTIELIDADGSHEHQLSLPGEVAVFPAWSPTGDQIVYGVQRGIGADGYPQFDLVLINADGSNRHAISAPDRIGFWGQWSWSPDGRRLLVDTISVQAYLLDPTGTAAPVSVPAVGDWQRLAP